MANFRKSFGSLGFLMWLANWDWKISEYWGFVEANCVLSGWFRLNGCKRDIFFTPMHGLLSLLGLALMTNSCSSPSVFNEVQVYVSF